MSDLCFKGAVELRRLIATRAVSCREVVDAHIARIEAINPQLNAIVTESFEFGRDQAAALDRTGASHGPLAGLPIAHKDLVATRGIRTTYGSPLFRDHVPEADDLIVTRMRDAGAVTIGKTNTPEFGAGSQTFNRVFGATRNPYDLRKTCGGSSGGAAVALAARLIPLADGSDTGGSLRNPAAFCNVLGFRPSPGRVPGKDPWADISTAGPMARSVDDLALLFSVLSGPDPRYPTAFGEPGATFREVVAADPRKLRVAVSEDLGGLPVVPEIRAAIRVLANQLAIAGARVVEATPDLTDARRIFHILRATGFRRRFGLLPDADRAELKDTIRWNLDAGLALGVADYDWVATARTTLATHVGTFFQEHDVLLAPTTQVLPFDLTTDWVHEIEGQRMATYIQWMESCSHITVTSCPALSLPAGFTDGGLPVGVQLIGPVRQDARVLRIAKAIEDVTGHAGRAPELDQTRLAKRAYPPTRGYSPPPGYT